MHLILPKGKRWLKYVKGRNDMSYPQWLVNIVRNTKLLHYMLYVTKVTKTTVGNGRTCTLHA